MLTQKNKRVAFVEPRGETNVFDKFMTIPLLGPLYLGTIASRAGYEVDVLNENIIGPLTREQLAAYDVFCVTALTATVERGKALAAKYKEVRAESGLESKTIIGGIHASMLPEDVLPHFDQVVVGEGQGVIKPLLSGDVDTPLVHGTRLESLDDLPFPDYSLVKGFERIKPRPFMSSMGCPHDCNFCSVTKMFGREYRMRSVENVIEELQGVEAGHYFVVDDYFSANTAHTTKLVEAMLAAGLQHKWSTQVGVGMRRHPELLAKMRKAGCRTLYVGFESVDDETLRAMRKPQNVAQMKEAMKVFHDEGFMVHGMFILGNDTDTTDSFPRTSEFCAETRMDSVQYAILTPLPGTQVYQRFEAEGRLLHKEWGFYDALHVVHQPLRMSPAELQEGIISCFKDFYSYANSFLAGARATVDSMVARVKSLHDLYHDVNFPSFYPALVKAGGKRIVNRWLEQNQEYMARLRSLPERAAALVQR